MRQESMTHHPLPIGLIGYGTIAQEVKQLLDKHALTSIVLVGALVQHSDMPRPANHPPLMTTCSALLDNHPQVVIEVAGQAGLREHGPTVLRAGIDLYCLSIGALADQKALNELLDAAQNGGSRLKIVSGGIGALDALAAASLGGLQQVIHTIQYIPSSVLPSEEADHMTVPQEVFRGSARQAALRFPKILNTAAAVALAGAGWDQTEVRVIADPSVKQSRHTIQAEGRFGTLRFEMESTPRSSQGARLVAMSVVHALQQHNAPLVIG